MVFSNHARKRLLRQEIQLPILLNRTLMLPVILLLQNHTNQKFILKTMMHQEIY
jgi:hypothetical protein